jgi:MFS family permease
MTSKKISALGRPMDYSDPTNVAIILITLFTLVAAYLYLSLLGGYAWGEAIGPSVGIAFSVFISWAISREISPDYPYSAYFGVAIVIIMIIYIDSILHPHYLSLFWILFFSRALNRSTGIKPKLFDSVLIIGLTLWLSFTYSWIAGIIASFAFWLDASLKNPQPRHKIMALLSLLIAVVSFIINPIFLSGTLIYAEVLTLLIVSILFLSFIFMTKEVKSKADFTPQILDKQRLRFTQAFSMISLLLFAMIRGADAFYGLAPLWTAMGGVFIHSLFVRSAKKTRYMEGGQETMVK